VAVATLNGFSMRLAITSGCPQGCVLSPLLWCLVGDVLLARLSRNGVFIQGYAGDMSSRGGEIPKHGIKTHAVGTSDRRDMVLRGRTAC